MDRFAFDDDYVRRLREHGARTEQHFHDYFRPRLYSRLRNRLRSLADIDEVRQETFRRVLTMIYDNKLRDGRTLPGFVFTVCDNIVLELYRKNARTEPLDEHHPEPLDDGDAEGAMITAEKQQAVRRVLDEIKPGDAAILRALMEELPREEICRKFGVSNNYLRVLLHRARKHFRAKFTPPDETNPDKPSLPR
jgi:RNA polymerase sigma-70 factor (ECF subfamily)